MKNILLALPLLFLMACTNNEISPRSDYYTLNQIDVALLESANMAISDCMTRQVTHPCRKAIPPIQDAVKINKKIFTEADKVFANGDESYYSVALQTAQNALDGLKGLVAIIKNP